MNDAIAQPVDGKMFARLMAPFEPFEARPELAVAVSGGRDSLALALLAHDWATERDGRIVALIVDHGMRAASGQEADATRELLACQGIESSVLPWLGAKPLTGLQEAARDARYRLLRDACRKRGILHLLVAHHADDQAETVAMRAIRQSGPDGLAGMAALVDLPEVRLIRPLLAVPRRCLAATLLERRVSWIDDPSNGDQRFERARLRRAGVTSRDSSSAGSVRSSEEEGVAQACVALLEVDQEEAVALDQAEFGRLTPDFRMRLLSRVVQAVGGGDHPPRRDRLQRAVDRLTAPPFRGKSGRSSDFTLSRCRLVLRRTAADCRLRWIVRPEHGRKGGQPLIPAVFFACGRSTAPHLDKSPT